MHSLFQNWHLMRWIKLSFGLLLAYQAIIYKDYLSAIIAIVLLWQAIANVGCCGQKGCTPSSVKKDKDPGTYNADEIQFEEVQ